MKKLFVSIVFSVIVSTGAFAQSNSVLAGGGAGLSIPSVCYINFNISYERMIVPNFSAVINAGWDLYPLALFFVAFMEDPAIDGWSIDAQARWYPWAKTFHIDLGAGYGEYLGMGSIVVTPGLGWKIDFGEPGGFVMNIGIRGEWYIPIEENIFKGSDQDGDLIPFNFFDFRLAFGYSF
ncbi:MAG: hypothetical protein LBG74_06075 [Spirochaetaceae bacterium]|nr:hypothetical protein [Spirochaetaceae bacterium]